MCAYAFAGKVMHDLKSVCLCSTVRAVILYVRQFAYHSLRAPICESFFTCANLQMIDTGDREM